MRWLMNDLAVATYDGACAKVLAHRNEDIAKIIGLVQSEEEVVG